MKDFLLKLLPKKSPLPPKCTAVIAAAGASSRMGGENKLFLPLGDKPVLVHTILAVERSKYVTELIIPTRESDLLLVADLCKSFGVAKPVKVIIGGATRQESVRRAAAEADASSNLIAVQDGARPFVTPELIDAVIEEAAVSFAAAPAIPVHDTIKVAEGGIVRSTPDRETLFAVQTPQVFDAALFRAALQSAAEDGFEATDDCALLERLGKEVSLTEGSEENIKITTPLDMVLALAIRERREA